MYVMGYSLDNLSLLALTLAVGFVVDDAIVMLETSCPSGAAWNRWRRAFKGSKEIGFTIISMTLSLTVFIPVDVHERHRRAPAARVLRCHHPQPSWSGWLRVVTLTPMLCSRFVRPAGEKHGWLFNAFERGYEAGPEGYRDSRWPGRSATNRW